ncbi:MAG: UDP-N-acetylglucosamine--N-acetylmuramyl-(pentapeptide) pyrophosphoryl-undecaprenol N-acetylglucosamine transferase [Candidatus Zambryskibacteria bacterium]|nr:UDP-N-acetylglucosamine--N-acetylmuramyl-(pentapeptide) pyrophosphoryl-undecaprenol N-acetylglucosamine transferase [Candidatus Zambryskibacteria bacterium]
MRILFTGGGTGGHFYPIISIAEELSALAKEKKLLELELFFMSPTPYDAGVLYEHGIIYKKNSAGKIRRAPGILSLFENFIDIFKTGWGILSSIRQVYAIYPDVIFGKGGYTSFPALLAGKLLRIPVVIHESDTVPGRVNLWAAKFASKIAVSYREAAKYFPPNKVAYTGNPVRRDIATPKTEGAREFLKIEEGVPVILILGGSQGARKINDTVLEELDKLVEKYVIIHQVGKNNFEEVKATSEAVLFNSSHKDRYKPFDYLNNLAIRMAAGVASVVVSRAGSTIFEIASWAVPSIIIPINERVSRDQRSNAFAYARAGACSVIEEDNLTPAILASEIERLVTNEDLRKKMGEAAKTFFKPDAARLVAEEILKIALAHEIEK